MSKDIGDLLVEWETRQMRGESVSVSTLCSDCPELATELSERILGLQNCNRFLEPTMDSVPKPIPVPQTIGKYLDIQPLGQGGFGIVYQGFDLPLDRKVAVKVLFPRRVWTEADHQRLVNRFGREGQLLAKLKHPNIVTLFDLIHHQDKPSLVMQYAPGGSLLENRSRIAAGGPQKIAAFMSKVISALRYAHEMKVMHRDLKPANILLDDKDEPLISDFGLAKLFETEGEEAPAATHDQPTLSDLGMEITRGGERPGTIAYMAPEQFDNSYGPVHYSTDIWAIGIILYELLSETHPKTEQLKKLREEASKGNVAWSVPAATGLEKELRQIVVNCLRPNPALRYSSAANLETAFQKVLKRKGLVGRYILVLLPMMMFSSVVVGSWLMYKPTPQPSEKVLASLGDLQQGKAVEYIRSAEDLAKDCKITIDTGNSKVTKLGDLPLSFQSTDLGFLEFLPMVPVDNYRIEAEICHTYSHGRYSIGGIYYGHVPQSVNNPQIHGYCTWGIADFDDSAYSKVSNTVPFHSAMHHPVLTNDLSQGAAVPRLFQFKDSNLTKLLFDPNSKEKESGFSWRKLEIKVKRFSIEASMDGATLTPWDTATIVNTQKYSGWSHNGGMGIYVYQGAVSCRRFIITPLRQDD